jgi:hypothetical protein
LKSYGRRKTGLAFPTVAPAEYAEQQQAAHTNEATRDVPASAPPASAEGVVRSLRDRERRVSERPAYTNKDTAAEGHILTSRCSRSTLPPSWERMHYLRSQERQLTSGELTSGDVQCDQVPHET